MRLHRRHSCTGRVQGSGSGQCYRLTVPIREPGFDISKTKCVLELIQSIEFLGFSVNSVQQELSLSARVESFSKEDEDQG